MKLHNGGVPDWAMEQSQLPDLGVGLLDAENIPVWASQDVVNGPTNSERWHAVQIPVGWLNIVHIHVSCPYTTKI